MLEKSMNVKKVATFSRRVGTWQGGDAKGKTVRDMYTVGKS